MGSGVVGSKAGQLAWLELGWGEEDIFSQTDGKNRDILGGREAGLGEVEVSSKGGFVKCGASLLASAVGARGKRSARE